MVNGKINFCLIGAGSIGRRHLRLLRERDDVAISVVDPSDESWKKAESDFSDVKRYTSFDSALENEKFDAVIVATPHKTHSKLSEQALTAGLNDFCEKPMSDSMEECVAMLNATKASSNVFSVGFMFRFDPFVRKVKELINENRIGKILHYYSRFATYNTLLCSVTRHQENTPYSLIMDCIHDTDLLYFFTGRIPDYVYASAYKSGDMELSSPQNVIDILYRYDSGDIGASCHFNYVEHPQVHTLEIVGDKGYIQGDFMSAKITVGSIDGTVEYIDASRIFDDVYRAEWDNFIRSIRKETLPENPADSAIISTLLMYAQRESAQTGKEVSVRSIAERYGYSY